MTVSEMMRSKMTRILLLVLLVVLTGCGTQPVKIVDEKKEENTMAIAYTEINFTKEKKEMAGIQELSGKVVIPATFQYDDIYYEIVCIGDEAFWGCTEITELILPEGVTSIGNEAFFNCKNMKSLTIPDSITDIGYGVFQWCESLKSIRWKGNIYTSASDFETAWEQANENLSEE